MNKYYYDCPIAAAYMMKNFGVDFIRDGEKLSWKYYPNWIDLLPFDELVKNYIHPDSMKIYEPKAGDVIERYVGGFMEPWKLAGEDRGVQMTLMDEKRLRESQMTSHIFPAYRLTNRLGTPGWGGIIQRNGLSFIWPKTTTSSGS